MEQDVAGAAGELDGTAAAVASAASKVELPHTIAGVDRGGKLNRERNISSYVTRVEASTAKPLHTTGERRTRVARSLPSKRKYRPPSTPDLRIFDLMLSRIIKAEISSTSVV